MPISPAGPSSPELAQRSLIIERIEREARVPDLANILTSRLAPTDLQSLLLEVYGRRAKKRSPNYYLRITSQTGSPRLLSLVLDVFLNGIASRSLDYLKSSSPSNSHRSAR